MLTVRFLTVGSLKEDYWRQAAAEYGKRLQAFCKFEMIECKESRLPDQPTEGEIRRALAEEAHAMMPYLPPRAFKIAMCVEGKQYSSETFAARMAEAAQHAGEVVFVIGSSFGLDPAVKALCDLRLSVSSFTYPHQLFRVMLLESVYRCFQIQRGTRYHK